MSNEAIAEAPVEVKPEAELETERDLIRASLVARDSGDVSAKENASENSPAPENLASGEPEQTKEEPEKEQTKAEDESRETPETKPQSEKEAKEQERFGRNWTKLQADNAANRIERESLSKEKADITAFKEKAFLDIKEARHKSSYRPEDYEAAAEEYEAQGDDVTAERMRTEAGTMREERIKEQAEFESHKAQAEWNENFQALVDKQPELAQEGSDLNNTVRELFKARPMLEKYPDGIKDAVQFANMQLENQRLANITAERDSLAAKVKELEQKLQPGGAQPSPTKQGSVDDFDAMTLEEQRQHLRAKVVDHDASISRITT